ncbi:polysaccharide deacetylase family protein [Cellulosilyticum sp. I15G10I2]|uniref:polysaccharide deacetylase family protein n=1 Tax=Cellulosilyticum sp. I15G10I2 TaxID=1892843 RepID=UPI00085C5C45|nr:polysaccharide deacetylase family protein [Cellulosilyticum sp. I15G10I2]
MKYTLRKKPYLLGFIVGILISSVFNHSIYYAADNKLLPIYCVNTNGEKLVALTFDAAWGADDTDQLIAILDKYNVKATFFIVGDWVRKYPDAVKKFAAAGHDIANHSDKHPHVNNMSKEAIKKDIMAAHQIIKEVVGKETNLYRPPYGEYNNTVIEAAKECNYHVIQWDVDSLDWKEYGLSPLIDKVLNHKNLRPGSIILLHNDSKYTAQALEPIIKGILEKGYKIVPISKLVITDQPYKLDFEGRQHKITP